jgi:hypothetical protein
VLRPASWGRWDTKVKSEQPPFLNFATLQALADLHYYTPDTTAPLWLQGLGAIASRDPGVLAIAGPSGLTLDTDGSTSARTMPDAPSMFLAGLVDRVRGTERKLAIGLPPAARHLPLLLAGAAVLANVVDRMSGTPPQGDGSVLIVSPDLEVRSRYCDLRVGTELLESAYPGSRMRPDGSRIMLSHEKRAADTQGVCFFLPGLSLPGSTPLRPALILVDMRYGRWVKRARDLAQWTATVGGHAGLVALYTIGDTDTQSALVAGGFVDVPLDASAVAACVEHVPTPPTPLRAPSVDWALASAPTFLTRDHEILFTSHSGPVEAQLTAIHRVLTQHAQQDTPDLRRARWLLAVLGQVPVPLVTYEYSARALGRSTLRHMIDRLGSGRKADYGTTPLTMQLKDLFDHLYQTLWEANPREAALRELLPVTMTAAGEEQVLLLVRDRACERALQDWVAIEAFPDAPWLSRLEIRSCATYFALATRRYRRVIANGALPRRYKWIAGAALGAQVTFLVYGHEAEIITQQLAAIYGAPANLARTAQRNQVITALSPVALRGGGAEAALPPLQLHVPPRQADAEHASTKAKPEKAKVKPQMTITDLTQLGDALQRLEQARVKEESPTPPDAWTEDAEDEEQPEDDVGEGEEHPLQGASLHCIRVAVTSRAFGVGSVYFAEHRPVEVFRESTTKGLELVLPSRLRPGDVLLLTHDAERTNLFERIVQLVEGQPHLQYLAARRKVWQEAVRRMAARYSVGAQVDYARLLRALQTAGAPIVSELAVRFWVQGDVIGPESVKSIIAVGRVSGVEVLVGHAREFDQTFRYIRGIHQGIGMRLSNAIRCAFRSAAGGAVEQPESRLDDRLGIALDELLDSIDLAEVTAVEHATRLVALPRVGRFLRE